MANNEERSITIIAQFKNQLNQGLTKLRKDLAVLEATADETARSGTNLGRALRSIQAGIPHLLSGISRLRRGFESIGRGVTSVIGGIGRFISRLTPLGLLLGGVGAVFSVRKLADWNDQWIKVGNRIRLVTTNLGEQRDTLQQIFQIAQDTRRPVEATADLWYRIARNAKTIGISQNEALQLTRTISQAAQIGGGTQTSIDAALFQFGQIIASPNLSSAAQEINSIHEQAPALFNAILAGFGKITGQINFTRKDLLALIDQGKVSSKEFLQAILSQADQIDKKFKTTQVTIGQAFTRLGNSIARFVGLLSGATGAGAGFARMISRLAATIDRFADSIRVRIAKLRGLIDTATSHVLSTKTVHQAREKLDGLIGDVGDTAMAVFEAIGKMFGNLLKAGAEFAAFAFVKAFGDKIQSALSFLPGVPQTPEDKLKDLQNQYDEIKNRLYTDRLKVTQHSGNPLYAFAGDKYHLQSDEDQLKVLDRKIAGAKLAIKQREQEAEQTYSGLLIDFLNKTDQAVATAKQKLDAAGHKLAASIDKLPDLALPLPPLPGSGAVPFLALPAAMKKTPLGGSPFGVIDVQNPFDVSGKDAGKQSGPPGFWQKFLGYHGGTDENKKPVPGVGFLGGIDAAISGFKDLTTAGVNAGQTIGEALTEGLGNSLVDVISGVKSAGEAFRAWAGDLLSSLAKLIAKMALLNLYKTMFGGGKNALFGGGTGSGSGLIGGFIGSLFNSGGLVGGSGGDRDSVPAMLTPGEYVIRRQAVRHVGTDLLNRINGIMSQRPLATGSAIQRFNAGGQVAAASSGGSIHIQPVLVSDSHQIGNLVAASKTHLLRQMRANQSQYRAALGV